MIRNELSRIAAALALFGTAAAAVVVYPALAQNLPEGNGKDAVQMVCTGCHDLSPVTEGGFSKEDWATVIKSMVEMGADIKPDQATLIVNYLAANFPPKQK